MTRSPSQRLGSQLAFLSLDFKGWPVPEAPTVRPLGMEPLDDPSARVRAQRLRAMIDELIPKVRRLNPSMPDDQMIEPAESMAELRLLDEEMG